VEHSTVLVHLGGGSSIHGGAATELEQLRHLAPNIFALVNSERLSDDASLDTNHADFSTVCRDLGIHCHVLTRRATESYFTDEAAKDVFGPSFHALQPYESVRESGQHWNKRQNWRVASRMRTEDIENTDLGEFLSTLAVSIKS
jgi:hypothetical protein